MYDLLSVCLLLMMLITRGSKIVLMIIVQVIAPTHSMVSFNLVAI